MTRIDDLIEQIDYLQFKEDTQLYKAGLFPSQRSNRYLFYCREDSNIYFSALIAFTLLSLTDYVSEKQKQQFHSIADAVIQNYPFYKSNQGLPVYNFYQIYPCNHYPNGYFFSKFKHFKLAEDADDTCIIGMTLKAKNLLTNFEAEQIKDELIRFSNLNNKTISSTLSKYKNLKAYGVWFGTGKMPIEFDFCVIANALCFVIQNNLPFTPEDYDSFQYLKTAIIENDIESNRFEISYMYPDTTIMLYHAARLYALLPNPELFLPDSEIIQKLNTTLNQTSSLFKKIMLTSALIKMGKTPKPIPYSLSDLKADFKTVGFFSAPMLKGTNHKILNWLAHQNIFHLVFDCEAYYYTLVLEYEILIKQSIKDQSQ